MTYWSHRPRFVRNPQGPQEENLRFYFQSGPRVAVCIWCTSCAKDAHESDRVRFFYITDLLGKNTQKINIPFMTATDVEDISVGPCASGQCIFVVDIGDNAKARKAIEIWTVPETETL